MKNVKTISARVDQYTIDRIEAIKRMYANAWNCDIKDISTSDIIIWSIGNVFYETPEGEEERLNNIKKMEKMKKYLT